MFARNLTILILPFLLLGAGRAQALAVPDCVSLAKAAETTFGMPEGLLQSISTVEASRIQPDGSYRAWPWTLNDSGKGLFFESADEVIAYLDTHLIHPDTSIDVGCMQINTKWHGAFFETLEEMLDPESNIAYAAIFLTDLYHAHGNWEDAIRHYHSSETKRNGPYLERVLATWTSRSPKQQNGGIHNAVFQVPVAPLATAADDAFATALAEARDVPVTPVPMPVALPLAKPANPEKSAQPASPITLPDPVGANIARQDLPLAVKAEPHLHRPHANQSSQPTIAQIEDAGAKARLPAKPEDPDENLKRRQKHLVADWDRVLMFRAQFAGEAPSQTMSFN